MGVDSKACPESNSCKAGMANSGREESRWWVSKGMFYEERRAACGLEMQVVLCGSRGREPWAEVTGRQAEAPNEEGFSPRVAAQKRAASPGPESLQAKEHS